MRVLTILAGILILVSRANAADYHVGPGQTFTAIGAMPWYRLEAGDTVYIHYRAPADGGAYHEKFLISGRGTAAQWIRVLGVPDPTTGALPIISGDGATTGTKMHYHWQDRGANGIQWLGVVQIAVNDTDVLPAYIEVANLQIQDSGTGYSFTAENGQTNAYYGFAACMYAKSPQHILIRNNILTNCGNGFYNWMGSGGDGGNNWWDGVARDIVLRGNYFYNNGMVDDYSEHQSYTESDGITIEYNRFGTPRTGMLGNQIKDRSAGTVIRYNYIEQAPGGYDMDLVHPQEGWDVLGASPKYKQTFVYGNIIVNKGNYNPNYIHWNEDDGFGNVGRAEISGGKLFFYDNTVVTVANQSDMGSDVASSYYSLFNETFGGYECGPGSLPGRVDLRNNILVTLPRTAGSPVPKLQFSYCGKLNFDFGNNWVTSGYIANGASVTGTSNIASPISNDPGFVNVANNDYHLASGSSAIGIGEALAPEVTNNSLGLNLTPTQQYVYHQETGPRGSTGAGSDVGAFAWSNAASPDASASDTGRLDSLPPDDVSKNTVPDASSGNDGGTVDATDRDRNPDSDVDGQGEGSRDGGGAGCKCTIGHKGEGQAPRGVLALIAFFVAFRMLRSVERRGEIHRVRAGRFRSETVGFE